MRNETVGGLLGGPGARAEVGASALGLPRKVRYMSMYQCTQSVSELFFEETESDARCVRFAHHPNGMRYTCTTSRYGYMMELLISNLSLVRCSRQTKSSRVESRVERTTGTAGSSPSDQPPPTVRSL